MTETTETPVLKPLDPGAPSQRAAWPIGYDGDAGELFGLVFKVGLLTMLTLGIYRFWAKTRIRQYLWSAIHFGGSTLEYHGRATELLIGFLIALAILAPLFFLYGLLTEYLLPPTGVATSIVQLLWILLLLSLYGAAIFRMTRYRLSRTGWRSIRFGLDGSTIHFARLFLGTTLLTGVTLGIAYPWQRKAMIAYRVNHARFGTTPFAFEGSARPLLGAWLPVLASVAVPVVLLIVSAELGAPSADGDGQTLRFGTGGAVAMLMFLLTPLLFIRYRVHEFRQFASAIRLGDTVFSAGLRTGPIVGAAVLTTLASIAALAVLGGLTAAIMSSVVTPSLDAAPGNLPPLGVLFTLIPVLLAVFALIPAMNHAIFINSMIGQVCSQSAITNPGAFEAAARSAVPSPQYGEGLADAFDVGAF